MQELLKKKRLWLALGIFSAVSAVLGTVGLALSALEGLYVLAYVLVPVVGHGFYGVPFYFTAAMRTSADISVIAAYGSGASTIDAIVTATGLTKEATLGCASRLGINLK